MKSHHTHELLRPKLCIYTPESEFLKWYWLKSELISFCREIRLKQYGIKEDLTERIAAFLGKRETTINSLGNLSRKHDTTPEYLTLHTIVVPGFRLSSKLRSFFVEHIGNSFHFNQTLRDFFKEPAGQNLSVAINLYIKSQSVKPRPIGAQFEYNKHIRDFFVINPSSSIKEAQLSWWNKRNSLKTK